MQAKKAAVDCCGHVSLNLLPCTSASISSRVQYIPLLVGVSWFRLSRAEFLWSGFPRSCFLVRLSRAGFLGVKFLWSVVSQGRFLGLSFSGRWFPKAGFSGQVSLVGFPRAGFLGSAFYRAGFSGGLLSSTTTKWLVLLLSWYIHTYIHDTCNIPLHG